MGDLPSRRTRTGNELTDQIFEGPLKHVITYLSQFFERRGQKVTFGVFSTFSFTFEQSIDCTRCAFKILKYLQLFPSGNPKRRSLLPDHETVDRQPKPDVRGERLGIDVAGHGTLCLFPGLDERIDLIPEDSKTPNCHGFDPEAAKDTETWPAKVPTSPSRGRGHPAQDHPDLPQGVLP
jgi:hypothetical protein